ncbi:MAG: RrF2 family transcriptional regulator [Ruminococcus callidus]
MSTKVECGIIALIDIALHSENGEAVAVSSISKRQNISVKYLEQILVALRQTHLIRGIKGFKGGYVIARPADKISFQEIIDALDITILGVRIPASEDTSLLKATVQECLWGSDDCLSAAVLQQHYVTGYDGSLSNSIPQDETFMYYI